MQLFPARRKSPMKDWRSNKIVNCPLEYIILQAAIKKRLHLANKVPWGETKREMESESESNDMEKGRKSVDT